MPSGFLVSGDATRTDHVLDIFGDLVRIKVSSADAAGSCAVITSHTPPQGGPPLHLHISDDEAFYVLRGTFAFELDGEIIHAQAGDTVFIPAGVRDGANSVAQALRCLPKLAPTHRALMPNFRE